MASQNSSPKYIRAISTVIFDEIPKIRSLSGDFDKLLAGLFITPGTAYAVGDAAPPSVPRLNFKSKFGHSSLDMSSVSAQMTTHFDGEFSDSIEKVKSYCLERQNLIEADLVRIGSKIRYVGFTLTSQVKFSDSKTSVGKILDRFFQKSVLLNSKNQPHEAAFKMSFTESDRYFVNFHISNYRAYTLQLPKDQKGPIRIVNPSLKDFVEADSGLEITFDCNNKYAFDFVDKDSHKTEDFKKIIDLADTYQANLIKGGLLNV